MSSEFNKNVGKRLGEKIAAAALFAAGTFLQTEIKKRLNLGKSPPPSIAPDGPFKQTGNLGRSIQVDDRQNKGQKPLVRVGTAQPYAARLEFGFSGTDRKGKRITQAARPYMRDTLAKNIRNMQKAAMRAANGALRKFASGGGSV
jgi:phage gpG-like protein